MVHEMIDDLWLARCATVTVVIHDWAPDIQERGIDELNPIWNMLDLTPQGRGTFYASLDYGTKVQAARR